MSDAPRGGGACGEAAASYWWRARAPGSCSSPAGCRSSGAPAAAHRSVAQRGPSGGSPAHRTPDYAPHYTGYTPLYRLHQITQVTHQITQVTPQVIQITPQVIQITNLIIQMTHYLSDHTPDHSDYSLFIFIHQIKH